MRRKHRVKRLNGTIFSLFFKMAKVKVTKLHEWKEYFHPFYTFWSKNLSKAEQMTKLASTLNIMFHLL